MNRSCGGIAILLLAGSASLYGQALDGWGRAKWGVSKTQFLREYRVEKAREVGEFVVIPVYKIAFDSFSVNAEFDEGGLKATTLFPFDGDVMLGLDAASSDLDRAMSQGKMAFRIREMLTEKYRKPGKSSGDPETSTTIDDVWYLSGGTISLRAGFSQDQKRYLVRLSYLRRPRALDKL